MQETGGSHQQGTRGSSLKKGVLLTVNFVNCLKVLVLEAVGVNVVSLFEWRALDNKTNAEC